MNGHPLTLCGATLIGLPSGALFWPEARLLAVADLHLGKAERMARRGGALLPPYETADTLDRLAADIDATRPADVLCLGDSFDDLEAARCVAAEHGAALARLMAGRRWTWVEGNHDPGPHSLGGSHRGVLRLGPLVFRHIADPAARGEVSGHYHPKARLRLGAGAVTRPCFLADQARIILPAYGTYTGGLATNAPALSGLMGADAIAVLTGARSVALPMPRQ